MNVKKHLIPILLVCLTAGQIVSIYADNYTPHLQVTTKNTDLAAGGKGNIGINLYNGGDYDVTEIEALLSSATPGVSIINGSQKVINIIERGESAGYDVLVMVDQSVVVGAYPLSMTLSYLRTGRGIVAVTIPLSIIVDKPMLPMIKITASNDKITLGSENKLSLTVQNIAKVSTQNIDITLSSTNPLFLSVIDQINYQISELKPGASLTYNVSIKCLENMPIGAYSITAQVWYTYTFGIELKQMIIIPLEAAEASVSRSPVVTVKNLAPRIVLPGEEFSLSLEVSCVGASISNAKAVISMDVSSLVSPMTQTTVSLGDLSAGETEKLSYDLLLSGKASAGNIPLAVSINYIDSKGVAQKVTETITVPVENLVMFSLIEDTLIVAEKGSTTIFEGDLLLVGTGKVEFASIGVISEGPVQLVSGSSEYIGAIDPDSPVPFTIQFKIDDDSATGEYDLRFQVTYLNSRNLEQSKTISVPLQVIQSITVPAKTSDDGVWGWLRRLFGLQLVSSVEAH